MKRVFIAHPISGDVQANIDRVLKVCHEIHSPEIIPVVPYIPSLLYLDDAVSGERELGISANREYFLRGFVDELWLYGDTISSGMWGEIGLANQLNIPVIPMTEATRKKLYEGSLAQ